MDAKDIQEIQVFKLELKQKSDILKILEIINKSISYHIIFWVEHDQEAYISTASKHPHPTNDDVAVIDWIFTSEWFNKDENIYVLNLKGSLDDVFKDMCVQITGKRELESQPLNVIVKQQQEVKRLIKEISKVESLIVRSKQFNKKVDLNLKLIKLKADLKKIEASG